MAEWSPSNKKPAAMGAFNLASKASQRQMWRREAENGPSVPLTTSHEPKNPFDCIKQILPAELDPYEERRLFASRMARTAQRTRPNHDERQPYGVKSVDNNLPLATYDIDHGGKAVRSTPLSLDHPFRHTRVDAVHCRRGVHDGVLRSVQVQEASVCEHAGVQTGDVCQLCKRAIRENCSHPEDMGPGTYRLRMHTLRIKNIQGEDYTFASHTVRFHTPRLPAVESSSSSPVKSHAKPTVSSAVAMSQTPRFQSDTAFPENYASSKQQRVFYPPDVVYEKPSILRNTIKESVATSTVKYGGMTSNADRLMSTAAMVHNMPGAPKLHPATTDALGPGSYKSSTTQFAHKEESKAKAFTSLLPSEHTKDRFGMKPNKNAGFIEARFRRFCTG
ncbi:hypothetical protein, variant 2 [Aphanomyces astaci]|uniref:Uncharacterized protein n=1 Tax=Aphanomyces astaci TaxID=112090 RepID=W4G4Z1_APHAT|nr:hypothetical protein, variant 2 [Aphanomyces astaci]ETV74745.1 hypothetical protein, variant 2 [Aphanomyces astaci]|eukprot:XP_009835832.1 hypothetical protein, variant 2 [Aphanomyces astaci]